MSEVFSNSTVRLHDDSIVITGMGAATSLGLSVDAIWQAVRDGRSGVGPMDAMESPLPAGADGCQAVDLPDEFERELPREARYLRWSILAALREANANRSDTSIRRALLLGTTLHGMRAAGRFLRSNDYADLREFLAGDTIRLACRDLQFDAGAATNCSACASSLSSIALGITLLQTGQADQVIAGGYDAISEYVWAGFNSLRLVADGPLRPFARGRRGMKIGEGYAVVVLERSSDATKRGAGIRATVAGWAETSDAHHLTQPHPAGEGAARAMRGALARAEVSPESIDFVSAHATGTPDNDASEHAALATLLGERLPRVAVSCFKSQLGHTLGAAGAVELILAARALAEQTAPARPIVEGSDPEFADLALTAAAPQPRAIRNTINTSLGFGGANTSVVLGSSVNLSESNPIPPTCDWSTVCITGIGIILPGAIGNEAVRQHWSSGTRSTARELVDADFEHLLNARRVRRMSPCVKLLLAAATLATQHAKLHDRMDLLADTGAILGTTHGSAGFSYDYYSQIVREGVLSANPLLFAEGVPNVAAAHISMMLGMKRGCQSIIGTRTAGLDALRFAALRIAHGDADRLLVGAAEERHDVVDRAYEQCGMKRSAHGTDGFDTIPGSVAFVLESRASALSRGATILATFIAADAIWNAPPQLGRSIRSLLKRNAAAFTEASALLLTSNNSTWIDQVERDAIGASLKNLSEPPTSRGIHSLSDEGFSVSPLAALGAAILSEGSASPITALCSDWSGGAALASVRRGAGHLADAT